MPQSLKSIASINVGAINNVQSTATGISVTGDLEIADKIIHSGDTNTCIRFPANDQVSIETSGAQSLLVEAEGSRVSGYGQSGLSRISGAALMVDGGPLGTTEVSLQIAPGVSGSGSSAIYMGTVSQNNAVRITSLGSTFGLGFQENTGGPIRFSTSGAFDSVRITNAGDVEIAATPTAASHATRKDYVDSTSAAFAIALGI